MHWHGSATHCEVALLAEGVDRNPRDPDGNPIFYESPSSRRAWIEMASRSRMCCTAMVALLAEGVDRNLQFLR